MKGSTMRLLRQMILDKACADFIYNGWNILYNDIINLVGTGRLEELDEVSAYALLDWYERRG